jgi:hypothetical protein
VTEEKLEADQQRARELVGNDAVARRAIADLANNCAGPGVQPTPKPPRPQDDWKNRIRTR